MKKEFPQCNTCGICIGPDFNERSTTKVGESELCGFCFVHLDKHGFLQVDENHRFLPDGSTIKAGALTGLRSDKSRNSINK